MGLVLLGVHANVQVLEVHPDGEAPRGRLLLLSLSVRLLIAVTRTRAGRAAPPRRQPAGRLQGSRRVLLLLLIVVVKAGRLGSRAAFFSLLLLPPLLILVLVGVIGTVALSIFLPILSLGSGLRR